MEGSYASRAGAAASLSGMRPADSRITARPSDGQGTMRPMESSGTVASSTAGNSRGRRRADGRSGQSKNKVRAKVGLKDIRSYEKVIETFRQYDIDKNGAISYSELHKLMSDLNPGAWTEAETDRLLLSLDKNKNGSIDINEFIDYVFDRNSGDSQCPYRGMSQFERVMYLFRQFDGNRNGTLDREEFTHLMSSLQAGGWTAKQTEQVFSAVDANHSGEVDLNELLAYIFGVPQGKKHRKHPLKIEFEIGQGKADILTQQIANSWKAAFQDDVVVTMVRRKDLQGVIRVSAMNGGVVFWDEALMAPYRESPFRSLPTIKEWLNDMTQQHIPRLLESSRPA